jgi:hypothetical protein
VCTSVCTDQRIVDGPSIAALTLQELEFIVRAIRDWISGVGAETQMTPVTLENAISIRSPDFPGPPYSRGDLQR